MKSGLSYRLVHRLKHWTNDAVNNEISVQNASFMWIPSTPRVYVTFSTYTVINLLCLSNVYNYAVLVMHVFLFVSFIQSGL